MRVLIIDDEPDAAKRIRSNLELNGTHVLWIESLDRAIELLRFISFTHAFVDLRMSALPEDSAENRSGLQICQQLRFMHPNLIIVGYSNGFREGDNHPVRRSFLEMGANATFTRAELTGLPRLTILERIAASCRPKVFIGSSTEGLAHARQLQLQLRNVSVQVWNQGSTFGLGASTLESLERAVIGFDYAVFVFTPDDELLSRESLRPVARDNVLFELGLFMGKLGRKRAVVVAPSERFISLPSDLAGINRALFDVNEKNLAIALGPVATFVEAQIYENLYGLGADAA